VSKRLGFFGARITYLSGRPEGGISWIGNLGEKDPNGVKWNEDANVGSAKNNTIAGQVKKGFEILGGANSGIFLVGMTTAARARVEGGGGFFWRRLWRGGESLEENIRGRKKRGRNNSKVTQKETRLKTEYMRKKRM